jgi:hypothetical protein
MVSGGTDVRLSPEKIEPEEFALRMPRSYRSDKEPPHINHATTIAGGKI